MEIEIIATQDSTDYFAIDNLTFAAINVPTAVQSAEVHGIGISPNPTTGSLFLENIDAEQIDLYNLQGSLIKSFIQPGNILNIANQAKGLYFLRIKAGDQIYSSKILKE